MSLLGVIDPSVDTLGNRSLFCKCDVNIKMLLEKSTEQPSVLHALVHMLVSVQNCQIMLIQYEYHLSTSQRVALWRAVINL